MTKKHVLTAVLALFALVGCGPSEGPSYRDEAAPVTDDAAAETTTAAAPPPARPAAPAAPPAAPAAPRPAAPAAPQPARYAPVPASQPAVVLTVPALTEFDVEFLDPLSSETAQVGDGFRARLAHDIEAGGSVAIPAGSLVFGSVTEVVSTKKIGGQAKLALGFDRVELPSGDSTALYATFAAEGKKQTKKDAATIGGAAAGGAVLGRVLDKKHKGKSTILGAVVGAAVGTAIAAKNAGDPVSIDAGSVVALNLDEAIRVVQDGGRLRFDEVAMQGGAPVD